MDEQLIDEQKAVMPSHSTEVDTTSAWDNGVNERRVKSPSTRDYFRLIYAFLSPDGDPTRKSSYSYIHHMISADGTPGEANLRALSTGIGTLNGSRAGTILRGSDREGVYRHLAAHYRSTDREPPALMPQKELRTMIEFIETKSSDSLAVGSQISWIDDDGANYGSIVEISEKGELLIRQWKTDDISEELFPTENYITLKDEEVEHKSFINLVSNMSKEINSGSIVSMETPAGTFYGDVLTFTKSGDLVGYPQGMTMTGTEETPVALLRVWMWLDEEWVPTNVTITAEADSLMAVDSLPDPTAEDMQPESEPATEDQPAMDSGKKSLDMLAEVIAKALFEAGVKLDPPAGFSNRSAQQEEVVEAEVEVVQAEEVVVEAVEVAEEVSEVAEVAEVAEETVAEEAVAEESTDEPAGEQAEEVAAAEPQEQKSALTLDDLKEFQDLLRMI